jgi:cytochrome c553
MMKKLVTLLAIAALTALGSSALFAGQAPQTGVNGSMHDITYLGSTGYGGYQQDDFQRVCIFCHTPHNAQPNGDVPAPLWNHEAATVDLAPYTWAAPANLPIAFDVDPLIGPSRLCMGCHDGITAVDKHGPDVGTAAGTAAYKALPGTAMSSPGRAITDLTVTHPIGFLYSDAVAVRGLTELVADSQFFIDNVPDGPTTNSVTRAGYTYTTKKISDTMYSGYMTCASCHEVHNTKNSANNPSINTPGFTPNYFVWAREKNSALCLSCHIK